MTTNRIEHVHFDTADALISACDLLWDNVQNGVLTVLKHSSREIHNHLTL